MPEVLALRDWAGSQAGHGTEKEVSRLDGTRPGHRQEICLLDSGSSHLGESQEPPSLRYPCSLKSVFAWDQEEARSSPRGLALNRGEEGFLTQIIYPTGLSSQQAPVPGTRQENGMATRLDEGLEDFFSRRVMDESARCGIQAHPQFQQAPRP